MRSHSVSSCLLRSIVLTFAFLVLTGTLPPRVTAQEESDPNELMDASLLSAMEYRSVGPFRGGRSTTVTGVPGQLHTFLMGTTGGGVWRTEDAGTSWSNITDGFLDVGSIGAVEVANSDPNVIYVGTGSAGIRGNVSTGRGVWRSTDAGKSWAFKGLPDAGLIGRIEVHPQDPDLVYVAAMGAPFGKNEERGVYRSKDGGGSWERVLFVSDSTGAVDLSINPHNPREVYAALWRVERKPWTLIDASRDGGIYKTSDGGDSWEKLESDLPTGLTGRIGVSVSPANGDRVYALVSAADPGGGVYRSDDAGSTWQKLNRDRSLRQRHFYYSHIIADPVDENTVYVMNTSMYKSVDGGVTFTRIRVPHGDTHDLWVSPVDPDIMIIADDGGGQVSLTGGETWTTYYNQPTAEFYRVTVDNQFPYRLYGAQQDNSTISVPSRYSGDITPKQNWFSVGGAESGHISVHPDDPNLIYAGNYIGQIHVSDLSKGYRRDIMAYPQMGDGTAPRDQRYRFQWNAPILISPHDPDVVYHTSNYVHRTRDRGMSWEVISPDLTTDNDAQQDIPGGPLQHDHTGVEVYNTIFAFVESTLAEGELWAGSDDGLMHLSRDGGTNWIDITPSDMPPGGTVNTIDVSTTTPGRAVVAVYRFREDDFQPYVFLTNDWGENWDLLTDGQNGIPDNHPVRVVRMDPDREGLLYAGTEFGLFVSFDDGDHWQSFQQNLPVTPVADLVVHEKDLVVATHGRSFWILDDLTPVHQLSDAVTSEAAHLFRPRDHVRATFNGGGGGDVGGGAPEAAPAGPVIHYHLDDAAEARVTLEVLGREGEVIRRFVGTTPQPDDEQDAADAEDSALEDEQDEDSDDGPDDGIEKEELEPKAGMNRLVWNMRYPGPDVIEGSQFSLANMNGPMAPPGRYSARLTVGEWTATTSFELLLDPRVPEVRQTDMDEQFLLALQARDKISEIHEGLRRARSVRAQASAMAERVEAGDFTDDVEEGIRTRADSISSALDGPEESLIQTKNESGQDPINFPPMLDDQVAYLYSLVARTYGRPTEGQYERLADLVGEIQPHLDRIEEIFNVLVADLNRYAQENGVAGVLTGAGRRIPIS